MAAKPTTQRRCHRKGNCKLAWPEWCPAWNKWNCPVSESEPHREPKDTWSIAFPEFPSAMLEGGEK